MDFNRKSGARGQFHPNSQRERTESPCRPAEINGVQLARQFLVLNGRALGEGPPSELPQPDNHATVTLPGGREVTTSDYREGVRVVRVAQLDHSWSGGDAAFPYNDPLPPAATDLLGEFVEGRLRIG